MVLVSERRTRLEFERWIKELVDALDPAVERIDLVLARLTTHTPTSLDAGLPRPDGSTTNSRSTQRRSTAAG